MIVYKITNTVNGKVYVGQTAHRSLVKRWSDHCYEARHESPYRLHQAIRKHGATCFTIKPIYIASTQSELDWLEQVAVAQFKSMDYKYGYNMTPGGFGVSEEQKMKLSEQMSGTGNPMYGKPGTKGNLGNTLTEEQRARISQGRKGKGFGPCPSRSQAGKVNGFFGKQHTDESRACMSASIKHGIALLTTDEKDKRFKGTPKFGQSNPFFGKKHSDETRLKMKAYWAQRRAEKEAAINEQTYGIVC